MHHTTDTLSAADGTDLFTRRWTPDFGDKGSVVLVHGVHEHSGRHAYLAASLMGRGLDVFAYDARGHGHSGGARADVMQFEDYLTDLDAVMEWVRASSDDRPVVLMGHSMGGLVAASWVADRGAQDLAGLVLSSAALHTFPVPKVLAKAAPYVAKWRPTQVVTKLDLSKLSHDGAVEREYRSDELNTVSGIRARLAYELLQASERVQMRASAFTLPLYLFHGTADTITPPGGSEWLAREAPSDDVTLKLHDGLYHETMKEPEQDAVIGDVADWIEARISGASA